MFVYRITNYTVKSFNKPIIRIEGETRCGLFMAINVDSFGRFYAWFDKSLDQIEAKSATFHTRINPARVSLDKIQEVTSEKEWIFWAESIPILDELEEQDAYQRSRMRR